MKRRLAIILVGLAFPCSVLAQAPAQKQAVKPSGATTVDRAAAEQQIIQNERTVLGAFFKGDVATFKSHVLPEAFGLDATVGIVKVGDWEKMMKEGLAKSERWDIGQPQVHWIRADAAILTYHLDGIVTVAGKPTPGSWGATVYVNRGGKWLSLFNMDAGPAESPSTTKK